MSGMIFAWSPESGPWQWQHQVTSLPDSTNFSDVSMQVVLLCDMLYNPDCVLYHLLPSIGAVLHSYSIRHDTILFDHLLYLFLLFFFHYSVIDFILLRCEHVQFPPSLVCVLFSLMFYLP